MNHCEYCSPKWRLLFVFDTRVFARNFATLFLFFENRNLDAFLSRCVTWLSSSLLRLIDNFSTFRSFPAEKFADDRPVRSFEQFFAVTCPRAFFPHSFALVLLTSRGSTSSFEHISVRVTSPSSATRMDSSDSRILLVLSPMSSLRRNVNFQNPTPSHKFSLQIYSSALIDLNRLRGLCVEKIL